MSRNAHDPFSPRAREVEPDEPGFNPEPVPVEPVDDTTPDPEPSPPADAPSADPMPPADAPPVPAPEASVKPTKTRRGRRARPSAPTDLAEALARLDEGT